MLGVCVLVLIACAAAAPGLQKALGVPSYTIKGSGSAHAAQLVEHLFPELGSESDVVVFHSPSHLAGDRTFRSVIAAVDGAVKTQTGVRKVLGPYDKYAVGLILAGEHTALQHCRCERQP